MKPCLILDLSTNSTKHWRKNRTKTKRTCWDIEQKQQLQLQTLWSHALPRRPPRSWYLCPLIWFCIFGCPSSSIPIIVSEWLMVSFPERLTRQCMRAHLVRQPPTSLHKQVGDYMTSDNLQLPHTNKLEVTWDQTTSNILVYNLQLPYGRHG